MRELADGLDHARTYAGRAALLDSEGPNVANHQLSRYPHRRRWRRRGRPRPGHPARPHSNPAAITVAAGSR